MKPKHLTPAEYEVFVVQEKLKLGRQLHLTTIIFSGIVCFVAGACLWLQAVGLIHVPSHYIPIYKIVLQVIIGLFLPFTGGLFALGIFKALKIRKTDEEKLAELQNKIAKKQASLARKQEAIRGGSITTP